MYNVCAIVSLFYKCNSRGIKSQRKIHLIGTACSQRIGTHSGEIKRLEKIVFKILYKK